MVKTRHDEANHHARKLLFAKQYFFHFAALSLNGLQRSLALRAQRLDHLDCLILLQNQLGPEDLQYQMLVSIHRNQVR